MGKPKPHPGLQARKNKCIIGTVLTDIKKPQKAPQAFSCGPLIESGKNDFQVGNWVSQWNPHDIWTGPYLVTGQLSDLVYKVQAAKGAKPIEVHVQLLMT